MAAPCLRDSALIARLRGSRAAAMASGSVTAEVLQAGSSFVLQVLAAASLGPAGYGRFAIVLGLVTTTKAIQVGIRDTSIVLGVAGSELKDAVLAAQYASSMIAGATMAVVGATSGLTPGWGAVLLGLMVGCWCLEEMGRAHLIRDRRFGALVTNDIIYTGAAFATIGLLSLVSDLRLTSFLWAMAIGAVVSFVASIVQLPRRVYVPGRFRVGEMRTVLAFSGWRSAQNGVRPLVTTLSRVIIAGIASTAVLGQLETARLVIQPIWVLISGLGPFLLSGFVRPSNRSEGLERHLPVFAGGFALAAIVWSGCVAVTADFSQPLLVGDQYPVDRGMLVCWGCFYAVASTGFPAATLLVARARARLVFVVRAIDGIVGLAGVAVLVSTFGAAWSPLGLAVGAGLGSITLWRYGWSSGTHRVVAATRKAALPARHSP